MESSQELQAVIAEEIRCAEDMFAALEREHRALLDGKADELASASAAKADLVEILEGLESRRARLASSDAHQGAQWQRLRELIATCKQRNEHNGALLKGRAENARVALNALRGHAPALYGPRGESPTHNDTRPLGSA